MAETSSPRTPGLAGAPSVAEDALSELRALEAQGAEGLLSRVIDKYLEGAPQLLQQAEAGLRAGDAAALARAAHALKSSSAQVGAMRVHLLAKELEAQGRAASLAEAPSLLAQLREELATAQEGLAAHCFGAGDA